MDLPGIFLGEGLPVKRKCSTPCVVLGLLGLLLPCTLYAATPGHDRGVWFWQASKTQYGSVAIVGNPALEDTTIANFKRWGITTVYGGYNDPNTAAMRAWNRKLHDNGIASYLLLSETEYIFPSTWQTAHDTMMKNFVVFNQQAAPGERFAGLAFDIEPHILKDSSDHTSWKIATPEQRRAYAGGLLDFLVKTRALLDENGEHTAHIQASLATWYSRTDSITWANTADRDAWFATLAKVCDRISLMDFENGSTDVILRRAQEEGSLLHGTMRIALRANIGMEWKSPADFWKALQAVEAQSGQSADIQSYAILCADEELK
jgi:hypothetical protein